MRYVMMILCVVFGMMGCATEAESPTGEPEVVMVDSFEELDILMGKTTTSPMADDDNPDDRCRISGCYMCCPNGGGTWACFPIC